MKLRRLLLATSLAGLLILTAAAAAAPAPTFTLPAQLGFRAGDDWEPSIAADRFGHVYAFWNHYGFDPSCPACTSPHMELQISDDGGATWSQPRALLGPEAEQQHDPQIVVDPVDGRTVYTAFMEGDKASIFVAKSTDFGRTWRTMLTEPLERYLDKVILAVRGRDVYVVYNAAQKIYASSSHDGGSTWKTSLITNTNSTLGWSLASGGAVDSRGNVYFSWGGYEAHGKPSGPVNLFVTKSADGGTSWTTIGIDRSGSAPPCGCGGWAYWGAQPVLAVDGRDRVYVLYNASNADEGKNRMWFRRSSNGGRTWSARVDISLAPTGANNLFPAIVARGDGDVRIAWQDDRNGFDDGGNDLSARWNTYYRSSGDAGRTWSPEVQLSRFVSGYEYKLARPADGYLEPYGDYFELDIGGTGQTHVLWGEAPTYDGPGNVWYARGR